MALEELVKHIHRERLDFDAAFLEEALEEQKKGITEAIRGCRSSVVPTEEDAEPNSLVPQDPSAL